MSRVGFSAVRLLKSLYSLVLTHLPSPLFYPTYFVSSLFSSLHTSHTNNSTNDTRPSHDPNTYLYTYNSTVTVGGTPINDDKSRKTSVPLVSYLLKFWKSFSVSDPVWTVRPWVDTSVVSYFGEVLLRLFFVSYHSTTPGVSLPCLTLSITAPSPPKFPFYSGTVLHEVSVCLLP